MTEEFNSFELQQFFTFTLDKELFALRIAAIREVLELPAITRIPRAPSFMLGVVNLRGNTVPVIDLRRKFGMHEAEHTVDTSIVIIETLLEDEPTLLGALVDAVSEVVDIPFENIEPAPRMGTMVKSDFIKGIYSQNGQFVTILDLERIFSIEELSEPSIPKNIE